MQLATHPKSWDVLFPSGTRVLAIPDWRQPRVLAPTGSASLAWRAAGYYPAYRWTGRLYRLYLRVRALMGGGAARASGGTAHEALLAFLADVAPGAVPVAAQVGMPGLAQKLTLRLADATGRPVGFLKCAEGDFARERLRHEREILQLLPAGAGPAVLKSGVVAGLEVLLLAPVDGRHPPPAVEPTPALLHLTESLVTARRAPIEGHPWYRTLGGERSAVEAHVHALAGRDWPIALRHGDLAPWNLLARPDGSYTAIDWEYGSTDGLPGLDVAQYVLQVAMLVARWEPARAARVAAELLSQRTPFGITARQAHALVALAAYDTYRAALLEGLTAADARQSWRRAVWQPRP
jgi:hypothetical protein